MTSQKKNSRNRSQYVCLEYLKDAVEAHRGHGKALGIYFLVLVLLASFVTYAPKNLPRIYREGEIALTDVVADHQVLIKDKKATEVRRSQIEFTQPPVFDLSMKPYRDFEEHLKGAMTALRGKQPPSGKESSAVSMLQDANPLGYFVGEFAPGYVKESLEELAEPAVQAFILNRLLPFLASKSEAGLVGTPRSSRTTGNGVIIRNLDTGVETLRHGVTTLPDIQSLLLEVSNMARNDSSLSPNAIRAIGVILLAKLPETLTYNQAATRSLIEKAEAEMGPIYYRVQKGEIVARRGERVSADQREKLIELYKGDEVVFNWQRALGTLLALMVISIGLLIPSRGKVSAPVRPKDLYLVSSALVVMTLLARAILCWELSSSSPAFTDALALVFPLGGMAGFISMIFSGKRCVTVSALLIFLSSIAMRMSLALVLFHFLSSMLSTWLAMSFASRRDAVWGILPLFLGESLLALGALLLRCTPLGEYPLMFVSVCINSVLAVFIYFSLSPLCEAIFGYSTRFRLLECMSIEQPLMQRIMMTIPGTYNHSVVVASMVEAAAKDIGANSLLCKVAALYHDAGKLVSPMCFVENLQGRPNKHDRLPPSTSARIILSHVRKGVELCERSKLGQEVIDIVAQHHGTRTVRFFYQKAVDAGENPKIEDYSYAGPKPQTREAALLMIADSVEASSRVLPNPSPEVLRAHIDKITKGILMEGQLDEAALTFRDLSIAAASFLRVLTGLFHQRIAYPDAKDQQHANPGSAAPASPAAATGGVPLAAPLAGEPKALLGQGDKDEPLSLQSPK